jgi:hypothetical protein
VAFKARVEKLSSIAPKDTAEVILAITESGLHSSVKAGENSGEETAPLAGSSGIESDWGYWQERRGGISKICEQSFSWKKEPAHRGCRGDAPDTGNLASR